MPGGGDPWPRIVACTLWTYAATALHVVGRKRHRRHRRHARLCALRDDRPDQLALLIVEGELRAEQVRPADVAAAKVGAVAGAAVHVVEPLAARDERRIAGRALLRRKRRSRVAALTAGGPAPRPCGGACAAASVAIDPTARQTAANRPSFGRILTSSDPWGDSNLYRLHPSSLSVHRTAALLTTCGCFFFTKLTRSPAHGQRGERYSD